MNLYSTMEGSQPLDRNFGLKSDFLDKPLPVAQNLFTLEIVKKTDIYEARVKVSEVTFDIKDEKVFPIVHIVRR